MTAGTLKKSGGHFNQTESGGHHRQHLLCIYNSISILLCQIYYYMFSFYYSQTIEMNLVKSDKVLDISLFFHLEDLIHFISHQQEII